MLMLLASNIDPKRNDNYLISRDIGNEIVKVSGEIHDCEFINKQIDLSFPMTLQRSYTSCTHFHELILSVDTKNKRK
jgi:hypothetical protein